MDVTAPDLPLVPGRECGSCNVCCVALTIDDPELQKPQGYRCRNAQPDGQCAIYPARPQTCRTFFCGWRHLKWVKEALRPDRSGVLVRFITKADAPGAQPRLGIILALLDRNALKAEGLAETVAAAVAADIPLHLNVPGPPGYTSAIARINEAVEPAILARDKPALLRILTQLRAKGSKGDYQPIRMNPSRSL